MDTVHIEVIGSDMNCLAIVCTWHKHCLECYLQDSTIELGATNTVIAWMETNISMSVLRVCVREGVAVVDKVLV